MRKIKLDETEYEFLIEALRKYHGTILDDYFRGKIDNYKDYEFLKNKTSRLINRIVYTDKI